METFQVYYNTSVMINPFYYNKYNPTPCTMVPVCDRTVTISSSTAILGNDKSIGGSQ